MDYVFKKTNCKQAYSFIEIIIVVALLGIITSIGVASYNRFNLKRKLEAKALELEVNLRLVQNKAVSNEKDCSVCGGNDSDCSTIDSSDKVLTGWMADFSNSSKPVYYGNCENATFPNPKISLLDLDYDGDGSNDVDMTVTGPSSRILFTALGGTDLGGSTTRITLQDDNGNSYTIFIYPSGDIVLSD